MYMKKLLFILALFLTVNLSAQNVGIITDLSKTTGLIDNAVIGQISWYNGTIWDTIPYSKLRFDGDSLRGNVSGASGGNLAPGTNTGEMLYWNGLSWAIIPFANLQYTNDSLRGNIVGASLVEVDPIWSFEKSLYPVFSDTISKIGTKTDLSLKRDLTNNNFTLTSTSTADSIVTYENGVIKRMLIQDISTIGITKMSIDTIITSTGVNFITVSFNMVDDGIFPFAAGKTIKGEFYLSGRSERGTFFVASDGSVIVDSGYYLDNANTDGMIDVYDGGTNAIFKNRLGLAVDVVLKYTQL